MILHKLSFIPVNIFYLLKAPVDHKCILFISDPFESRNEMLNITIILHLLNRKRRVMDLRWPVFCSYVPSFLRSLPPPLGCCDSATTGQIYAKWSLSGLFCPLDVSDPPGQPRCQDMWSEACGCRNAITTEPINTESSLLGLYLGKYFSGCAFALLNSVLVTFILVLDVVAHICITGWCFPVIGSFFIMYSF